MPHISDYVAWRGDLSFSNKGFAIEDNLVLSELIYIDYKPVVKEGGIMTLGDAIHELDDKGVLKNTRAGSVAEDEDFARACGESKRFGEVLLCDFKDVFDSSDRQFAAVTYLLDDGTILIVFRGTDATIIGWKEDFMISYTNVPSQELALNYAKEHVDRARGRVIMAGHSKGAHLALYAAAHLDEKQQDKVVKIYMNDGPGFCNDVLDRSLIDKIRDKIVRITPEYSIIGRIFETEAGENLIVKSSASALLQHNMQSWMVGPKGLMVCGDHAPESYLITELVDRFVEGMDLDARENFVDSLFNTMSDSGATTIREFASYGPSAWENVLMQMAGKDALNLKNKAQKIKEKDDVNKGLFTRLWGLFNRRESVRIIITLFLSGFCFAFPDFAMESFVYIMLVIICLYEIFLTVRHLRKSEWDFKKERPRVTLVTVLVVLTSAVLVKEGALFVISSMILGLIFMSLFYQNVINFRVYNNKVFERFRYSFEGIVTFFLGGYILVVPDIENSWYMISCGSLLLIDAIFEILKMIRDRR